MKIIANAKINVYLKVLGKNKSGYHDLDSLMVPIDLCDFLEVEESDADKIIGMDIPLESNLIYKAIQKVRNKFKVDRKIKVVIEKNIPSFAGLGGGSSDAAAMIKALNNLWDLKMKPEEMIDLASEIGSDVPFFINNKPAIISGRGEKMKLVDVDEIQGILIFDGLKFSTKDVFANMKEYSKKYEMAFEERNGTKKINDYYSLVVNDMEKGISIYEESYMIEKQKQLLLESGAKVASMSGSGSSVFGLFEKNEDKKMKRAYNELKNQFQKVWIFKMVNTERN